MLFLNLVLIRISDFLDAFNQFLFFFFIFRIYNVEISIYCSTYFLKLMSNFNITYIIAHGGVSDSIPSEEKQILRKNTLKMAVIEGWKSIIQNKKEDSSSDAVEKCINVMESSNNLNAGIGAVKQSDGIQRMDASIMRGRDLEFGAVASLRGYENPISVAKYIMERGDGHNMYAFDFASKFADQIGIKKIETSHNDSSPIELKSDKEYQKNDTVGCVGLDFNGNISAGTSTGGRYHCLAGRIGDSPIIGAGTYCNKFCGVSLTGFGENITKLSLGKRVVDIVTYEDKHPQIAVQHAIDEYISFFSKKEQNVGIIAIDRKGRYGIGYTGKSMAYGIIIKSQEQGALVKYGILKGETIEEIIN
jgi:beta-aspartyl-peptidase (threonine type)